MNLHTDKLIKLSYRFTFNFEGINLLLYRQTKKELFKNHFYVGQNNFELV